MKELLGNIPWETVLTITILAGAAAAAVFTIYAIFQFLGWCVQKIRGLSGRLSSSTNTTATPSNQGNPVPRMTYSNWILWIGPAILGALLSAGVVLRLVDQTGWATIMLALALIYVGSDLVSVRAPNVGMVFSFNRLVGYVDAGFYLAFPFFSGIKLIPHDWTELTFPIKALLGGKDKENNPTGIGKEGYLKLNVTVTYRAKEGLLRQVLTLMPDVAKSLIEKIAKGWLTTRIGEMTFTQFVPSQQSIEAEVKERLNQDLAQYGYEIQDIVTSDPEEEVHRLANERVILGQADAAAMKAKADAIATPLKDNNPAAWVAMAQELAGAIVKAASAFAGRR